MATKLSDIQKRVLEVLRESKKATASQKEILAKLKDISQKDLVEQMNKLAEMVTKKTSLQSPLTPPPMNF